MLAQVDLANDAARRRYERARYVDRHTYHCLAAPTAAAP